MYLPSWEIIVIVNRLGLTNCKAITEIEIQEAKKSWLKRVYFEWFKFYELSKEIKPDVWLSLHDITPRVQARRQYVYCHNPSPFLELPIRYKYLDIKFLLFSIFYRYLYNVFIHRNSAVIVQQEWLRNRFKALYKVQRVIVAYPDVQSTFSGGSESTVANPRRFLYPAFPRVFKNFELLGEVAETLAKNPRWCGEIVLTIDGTENVYSRLIKSRYGKVPGLCFIGRQSPEALSKWFDQSDAILFPSLLETWGLPITEAKARRLPIVVADLPYARETVGIYDAVEFVDPLEPREWADRIFNLHIGGITFGCARRPVPPQPFADGWAELFHQLLVVDEHVEK